MKVTQINKSITMQITISLFLSIDILVLGIFMLPPAH